MSAQDSLLVVHNPYGLQDTSPRCLTAVAYTLDHLMRPAGARQRAIESFYYKRNSHDGRIVVVLSKEIDWTKHRAHLSRLLGEHPWATLVRNFHADGSMYIFEFDKSCLQGKRDTVEHFGYTSCFYAPAALDNYRRDVADRRNPLIAWEHPPSARPCRIPSMRERLELPLQTSASEPSPPPSLPSPPPPPQPASVAQPTTPEVKPFVKLDPYEEDEKGSAFLRSSRVGVKFEPGVKLEVGVKREHPEDSKAGVKREAFKQELPDEKKPSIKREVRFADDVKPKLENGLRLKMEELKPRVKAEPGVKQEPRDSPVKREDQFGESGSPKKRAKKEEPSDRFNALHKRPKIESH